MLTLAHIAIFKNATKELTDEARQNLVQMNRADLAASFVKIFEDAKLANAEAVGRAFLVFYLVAARKAVQPGTDDYKALRAEFCPVVTQWHKANPPVDALDLLDPDRVPSWLPELDAATVIAQGIEFSEAREDAKLACAIRNHFGLGGYEDLVDPDAIQATDPTMALMIAVVRKKLPLVAPHWFDGKVLKSAVDDARSTLTIKHEAEKALRAKKDAERAAKRQQDREAEQAYWVANKLTLISDLASAPGGLELINGEGDRLVTLGFDGIRAAKIAATPSFGPLLTALSGTDADTMAVKRARYERAAREALLMRVAELQPAWVATEEDGDLRLRRSLSEPAAPQFTRKGGEILRAIYSVVEKHGSAAVLDIIKNHVHATGAIPVDPVQLDELIATLSFKPTPEGLWRKAKVEATAQPAANDAV